MHDRHPETPDLGPRRFDLDWLRIGAFLLLILYHVGMYYVSWDWHVKSPHASPAIEPLMMLTAPWRLSLLFLVSGVATAYLAARGGAGFLRQRSARLLIPLAFGMLVIVPPQSYLEVVEKLGYSGSYAEFWRLYVTGYGGFCRAGDCLRIPTWNHLWFVAYLWVYTLAAVLVLRAWPRLLPWLRARAERALAGPGALLLPAALLIGARVVLVGRFAPTHALVDDWYNHAQYVGVFALGLVLARTRAPWEALARSRWIALALALLGWAALCAYFGAYGDAAPPPPDALRLAMRAVYGAEQWLAIGAALGFARRHLNRDSVARRYLTTAIFPVYILHQTLIVVLAHALKPVALAPPVEGLVLVLSTAALCGLGYEGIRRVPWLRPLFGLAALAPPRPPPAAVAAPIPVPQDIH
ncbi:MAG: acyltransferase family protein [Proteobacteria bacterium]|nr:acyltransferase family protein [Pseudomonadota bacterium]